MLLDKFNKFFYNNRYILFIGAIFIIIGYLQISYGIISDGWNYLFNKEPPVYIIKSRIENVRVNESGSVFLTKLNKDNKGYYSRLQLFDTCGQMHLIQVLVPADSPISKWSNKDFIRVDQENLTYSISAFTEKREGKFNLKMSSYDTKFSIEKQIGSVKKVGESKDVVGFYEQIFEIDLSLFSQNHETLFDLIPNKDEEIKIDCLGIKNCQIEEIKYVISNIRGIVIDGQLRILGTDLYGKTHKIDIPLPQPNHNKISIYDYDASSNTFIKISLDNSTNATNILFLSGLPCNKEGKIYIHPLGT